MKTLLSVAAASAIALAACSIASAASAQQLGCSYQQHYDFANQTNAVAGSGYNRNGSGQVITAAIAAYGIYNQHRETEDCQMQNYDIAQQRQQLELQREQMQYRLEQQRMQLEARYGAYRGQPRNACYPDPSAVLNGGWRCP